MTEAAPSGFAVELPAFSGPFRVLAELLLGQKVDVCDVPIASVTDGYLAYASEAERWSLEDATWFLAVCAVLLELKVGRLMPRHESVDEEDLLGVSPDLVYARRLERAAIRRAAEDLGHRFEEESRTFPRDVGPPAEFSHLYPDVMASVDPAALVRLAAALLRPPPLLDLSHVTPIRYTMAEAVAAVESQLGRLGVARFRDLVADCEDRIQVVVRFLAILELYREGKVDLSQADVFGEIDVRWESAA